MGALHLVLALYGTLALSIPLGKRQDDLGGGWSTAALPSFSASSSNTFGGGDASVFNLDNPVSFASTTLQDSNSGQFASGEPATAPTFPISNEPNSGVAQIASASLPSTPATFQLPPDLNLGSITPVTPIDPNILGPIAAAQAPVTPPVPETPATPPVTPAEPPATPPVTPPVAEIPAAPATPATPPVNPATPDSRVVATLASADEHIPLDKAPENTTPNPPDTATTGGDASSQALIAKLKESKDVAQTSNAETKPPGQTTPDKTPDPNAFLAKASDSGTAYTIDPNVKLDPNGKIPEYTVPKDGVIAALYDQDQKAQEINAATDPPDQQTAQKTADFLRAHPEIFQQVARANGYTNTRYSSPSSPITSTVLSTAAQLFSTIVSAGANRLVNPPVDNVKTQIQYNKAQLDLQNQQNQLAEDKRNQKLAALQSFTILKLEGEISDGEKIILDTQEIAKRPNLSEEDKKKVAAFIAKQNQQLDSLKSQLALVKKLTLAQFDIAQQQAQQAQTQQATAPTGQTPTGDQQVATNSGTTDPATTDPGSTASGTTDSGPTPQQQADALAAQQQADALAAQQRAQDLAAAQQGTPVATRTCPRTCLLTSPNIPSFQKGLTATLCANQGCPLGSSPDSNVVYVRDQRIAASGIQWNPAVNEPLPGSAIGQCTSSSNQVYLCRKSDGASLLASSSLTASSEAADKR